MVQDKMLTYHLLQELKFLESEKAEFMALYPMGFSSDVREKLEQIDEKIKNLSEHIESLSYVL